MDLKTHLMLIKLNPKDTSNLPDLILHTGESKFFNGKNLEVKVICIMSPIKNNMIKVGYNYLDGDFKFTPCFAYLNLKTGVLEKPNVLKSYHMEFPEE